MDDAGGVVLVESLSANMVGSAPLKILDLRENDALGSKTRAAVDALLLLRQETEGELAPLMVHHDIDREFYEDGKRKKLKRRDQKPAETSSD